MKPIFNIEIVTPRSLCQHEWGNRIFEVLHELTPFAPITCDNGSPPRIEYSGGTSSLEKLWRLPIFWRSKRPKSDGAIWMEIHSQPEHAAVTLRVPAEQNNIEPSIARVFERWSDILAADIAFIHLVTDADNGRVRVFDQDCTFFWTTHQLQVSLPDIFWCMVFGPPYVELFGRDTLLSAPAHVARELPTGQILIQLTEDLRDLETDYPRVAAVRERVKDHLGRDAFWSPAMATYRAPTFTFPESGQVLPPAKNPRDVCDDLILLLRKDADAALRANTLDHPIAWYVDHREDPVVFPWFDDPQYPTPEAKRARFEQVFQTRVYTAGGIARAGTVPTAKGPEPALLVHVEHKSGYGRRLALPYKPGWAYSGFGEPVNLDYAPYLFPR